MIQTRDRYSHERYRWLDQARGVIALLFIVSAIMWSHRGDLLLGKPILGPPWLDHGYNYYSGTPSLITIIDVGQPVFLFFVGFSGYIAFSTRLRKRGRWSALLYGLRRLTALYVLSILGQIINDVGGGTDWAALPEQFNWTSVFLTDVLAVIALGAGATYLSVWLIPNADRRAWFALALFIIHAFLYAILVAEHQPFVDSVLGQTQWPLKTISLPALAVLGSAFGQWIHGSPHDIRVPLKSRVIPVTCGCLALCWCMEWLQPSDHHEATMALMLLGAGCSGLLLVSTISADQLDVELPILTTLGRNLLVVFILAGIAGDFYFRLIPDELLYQSPWAALVLQGLIPIAGIVLLTRFMEKRGIVLRL